MSNIVPFERPQSVVRRGPGEVMELLDDYWVLAQRVSNTEFVPKAFRNRPEAVLAALLSGAERGLGPMESLRSINVIEGKPSLSAEAMRAIVIAAGHEITIIETTAAKAIICGRRAGSDTTSPQFVWTMDRARRARLANKDNWVHYPESMLLARASSDMCKAVFPDVVAGLVVAEVAMDEANSDEAPPTTSRRRRAVPAPPPAAALAASAAGAADPARPAAPADSSPIETTADEIPGGDQPSWGGVSEPAPPDPALARKIHAEIAKAFPDADAETRDRYRHALVAIFTRRREDGPVTSSNDLSLEEQLALSDVLVRIQGGSASVADGPDDTVELRAGGGWRYTVGFDPLVVAVRQGEAPGEQLGLETPTS